MARTKRADEWGDEPDSPEFIDSKEFKAYTEAVFEVILHAERPVSIGDIHRALRGDARPRWTCDAIASLTGGIEETTVQPTRWRALTRPIAGLSKPAQEDPLRRIFPHVERNPNFQSA